jgi:hypothetical protein
MGDLFKIIFVAAFVLAVVVGWPLAAIWAINVLFGLSIEFNSLTWLAAFILLAAFNGTQYVKK